MGYQRVTCPKGHQFMANVFGKGVRLTCERCVEIARANVNVTATLMGEALDKSEFVAQAKSDQFVNDTAAQDGGGEFDQRPTHDGLDALSD